MFAGLHETFSVWLFIWVFTPYYLPSSSPSPRPPFSPPPPDQKNILSVNEGYVLISGYWISFTISRLIQVKIVCFCFRENKTKFVRIFCALF
jgi:hypothetical protein